MADEKIKFEKSKLLFQLEKEFSELKEIDQKHRVYGKNPKLNKIEEYIRSLKALIIGEGCEFYELGWCDILQRKCHVKNKKECEIRKKRIAEITPAISTDELNLKRHRRKRRSRIKDYEFIKI